MKNRLTPKEIAIVSCFVLLVLLIIAGVEVPKYLEKANNVYVSVRNDSDGQIYGLTMDYSFIGSLYVEQLGIRNKTTPGGVMGNQSVNKPSQIVGDNTHQPFEVGERIDFDFSMCMPNPEYFTGSLRVCFFVYPTSGLEQWKRKQAGEFMDIPVERGKRTVLVLTGNPEDGYDLQVEAITRR